MIDGKVRIGNIHGGTRTGVITDHLNPKLCICGVANRHIPVIISSVVNIGGNPAQTAQAGLVTNIDPVNICRGIPGNSMDAACS